MPRPYAYPLLSAQPGIWWDCQLEGETSQLYTVARATTITGTWDPLLFRIALHRTLVECPTLGTRFVIDDEHLPRQIPGAHPPAELEEVDLRAGPGHGAHSHPPVGGGGPELTGFFFTAVPVGALIATALSGWLGHLQRPLRTLFILLQASFLSIIGFGAMALYSLPVAAAMGFLVLYGVLSSWSDVIQFTILQTETPDQVRGRVNGVWLAQEVSAESVGAMGTGAVGRALGGAASSMVLGTVAFLGLLGVVATSPHPSTSTKEPA